MSAESPTSRQIYRVAEANSELDQAVPILNSWESRLREGQGLA